MNEGNQFWKMRATHGRRKLFSSPKKLREAIVEYFTYTDTRKWIKKDWVGRDAMQVNRETETPYTIAGLCIFLGTSRHWWNEFKKAQGKKGFLEVMEWAEEIMYTQKFEGAAVGAFNSNIIARDLGLKDQSENIQKVVLPKLSPEERKKYDEQFSTEY